MPQTFTFITLLAITAVVSSCKKDSDNSSKDCFSNTSIVRQINNAPATVQAYGDKFFIVEQGTIDTKLNPCTLAQEFQVDNLSVKVTGDVKLTQHNGAEPCCTDNFVITQISK